MEGGGGGPGGGELEGMLRGLKLTEQERREVRGAWRSESKEAGKTPQAVGKLFSVKAGYADGMAQSLGRIWCPQKGIRCKELGNNLFLFSFLQPGGKRRAIMEGPWEFGGDLLIVVDFDETKRLKDLVFSHVPMWIRVFDLPLGLMNAETGRRIGDAVGKAMEVEKDEDELAVGEYLRVKVQIDVNKPLRRGIKMAEAMEGKGCWCSFKYEFLPNFCYSCGLLGHVERDCDDKVDNVGERQFGDWLRVTPTKHKDTRGRWSEGGSSGGGYQQKSSGSWRRNDDQGKSPRGVNEQSNRNGTDLELQDDGQSPLKKTKQRNKGKDPKKLTFVEQSGQLVANTVVSLNTNVGAIDESVVALEDGKAKGSEEQVASTGGGNGDSLQGAGGGEEDGGVGMEVDHSVQQSEGQTVGILQCGLAMQGARQTKSHDKKKNATKMPRTFKRRARAMVDADRESVLPPTDSRKRSVGSRGQRGRGPEEMQGAGRI